jgi:Na+-translocating ferredoxin:NAD+ oxidoreductase RnfD subunit
MIFGARPGPSSTRRAALVLLALAPPLALRAQHAPRFLAVLVAAIAAWLVLDWLGTRLRGGRASDMRADLAGVAAPAILLLCVADIAWPWLVGALAFASVLRHGLGGIGLVPFHPGVAAAALLLVSGVAAPAPALAGMPAACALSLALLGWRGGGVAWAALVLPGTAVVLLAPWHGLSVLAAGSLLPIAAFVASDRAQAGNAKRTQLLFGAIAGVAGSLAWLGGVAEPWPAALLAAQATLPWLDARDARRRGQRAATR